MKNLESIAEDLFNKIRGRFPSVTIGSAEGKVTNVPKEARYFDFEYKEGERVLGKVSISLDEDSIAVMYSDDFVANEDVMTRNHWYNFLKELRQFSKKRLLNFDTRNITKSNLDRRDYKFLANTRAGDEQMNESTMYGTSRTSFQNIGNARISIKHTQPVDQANPTDRTRHVEAVYIESDAGERFKYPFKHLTGARAMARHVSEGGTPYDDFGSHIVSMSEELSKLRKFKTYVGRSSVMAEGLVGYMDAISERMDTIRKSLKGLQRETFYKETFEGFEKPVVEDVPSDVAENWIDQLTIRQFNEELKDVFPFVYKVVSEYTKAKELGPDDLEEGNWDDFKAGAAQMGRAAKNAVFGSPEEHAAKQAFEKKMAQTIIKATGDQSAAGRVYGSCKGDPLECLYSYMKEKGISNPQIDAEARKHGLKGNANMQVDSYNPEAEFEAALEQAMGQFSDHVCEDCGNPSWRTLDEEKQKGVDGKVCWKGYKRMGTKMKGGKRVDNCVKVKEDEDDTDEGNAYANTVRQAKMNGKKKGDKVPHPNGKEEITLEKKTPLGEFILSYFDYTTGQFPKGETAVLTMIEKDYGEQYITPAKQFIERINNRVAEVMGYRDSEVEESGLQYYIGKKKYGKDGMKKLARAGRDGASEEELGRIKDQHKKESEDLRRLAGLR